MAEHSSSTAGASDKALADGGTDASLVSPRKGKAPRAAPTFAVGAAVRDSDGADDGDDTATAAATAEDLDVHAEGSLMGRAGAHSPVPAKLLNVSGNQAHPASPPNDDDALSPEPTAFSNTFAAGRTVSPPLRRRRRSSGGSRSSNGDLEGHSHSDGDPHYDHDLASSADEDALHRTAWRGLDKRGHRAHRNARGNTPPGASTRMRMSNAPRSNARPSPDRPPHKGHAFAAGEDAQKDGETGRPSSLAKLAGDVSIVVGSRRFICDLALFARHPNTMLGRMFGEDLDASLVQPNENGDFFISHNSSFSDQCFKAILDFYRDGKIRCPPHVSVSELHSACQFFLIPFTHDSVKCDDVGKLLHLLSNEGAEKQFDLFLEDVLTPAMARSASLGERECHIVCLSNEDLVEWDDELPPRLGEQYAQVVHSTSLLRYLKFYDNRVIAKTSLRGKGLKHVKIGIEGFPTFAEKIKREQDGTKYEVIYNYEQRPFIKLSWEIEDNKSRHVDFQTVKGRPLNTWST